MGRAPPAPAVTGTDARRRAHYLAALGIDAYASRRAPAGPAVAADELAGEWATLRAAVAACTKCRLCETRTQTVFGVGDTRARWLVVGEAPGAEEDKRGEPFVGRAGQLLNSMLRAVALSRDTVFIANVLKCRPPGNRDPRPDEVAACLPYLERQVALIEPALILAVGRIAAQNLLGSNAPLARLRGRVHQFGVSGTPLVVTYHPAYLLRSPGEKRKAWEDLKLARSLVDGRRPH
ncbi:MAG: uracil-DNA glycosylase [Steroidobacteraceae bacterium]|nr:uracil-DNA glycosylase [Steroidobacteraceae bacterium]